jgi:hypothetical protein
LFAVRDFSAFPAELKELLDSEIFLEVMDKARNRYLRRLSIDFNLDATRILTAHQEWRDGSPEPVNDDDLDLLAPRELRWFRLSNFRNSMVQLCSLLSAHEIVADTVLHDDATGRQQEMYEDIRLYPSEYFSLRVSYEGYRHFALRSRPDQWVEHRVERSDFRDVINLCRRLHADPMVDDVFELFKE